MSNSKEELSKKLLNKLNINAPSFKPNPGAAEFTPSWLKPKVESQTTSLKTSQPAKVLTIGGTSSLQQSQPVTTGNKPLTQTENKSIPQNKKTGKTTKNVEKQQPSLQQAKIESEIAEDFSNEDEETKKFMNEIYKEHLNIVFLGHVDAGKSTMGGNILYLTGMVDQRTMEKYEREAKEQGTESWYLSWVLDLNQEERTKGKTVECGRAYFETKKRRYTIIDAPGHKSFVPSMLTGASQADIGILVISARKGEFETGFERGGQTREHAILAKTSGINTLVVAVNKMDDTTVQWDKARFDECVEKITPFLKGTGYNTKTEVFFIPVSGYSGANIKDRAKECTWYNGPSLVEYLDNIKTIERKINAPLMMPVSEKFKDMGTIVIGKIESGTIKLKQSVRVMPINKKVDVTGIWDEENEVEMTVCGDNVRIRLRGVEEEELTPGSVVCSVSKPVKVSREFEAQLVILDHKNIICAGYNSVIHIHSVETDAQIKELLHLIDKKTGRKSKRPPPYAKKGQKIICILQTEEDICVESFEEYPRLGRFTLRDEGKTIAIGKVTRVCL